LLRETLSKLVKSKAPFIITVVAAFFVYQLLIFVNSFEADYNIAVSALAQISGQGSLSHLVWLISEIVGEIGVVIRFAGACFTLAFAIVLVWKKEISFSFLRKGVLLEGVYYLFNLPFIVYLLRANGSIATNGAALSYLTQLLLVTPLFLVLYFKLKRKNIEPLSVAKWVATAIVGFTFALWVKHFALAIYALPLSFGDAVFVIGFVNSALTLLLAGVLMVIAFMPVLRRKSANFNVKLFAAALILIGVYAIVFVIIALLRTGYMAWFDLVDWWIIVMPVLGVSLLIKDKITLDQTGLTKRAEVSYVHS
jgi:hypothetical protein